MTWILQNLMTILICLGLGAVLALSAFVLIRDKKKGTCSCGGCSGCSMSDSCHQKKD